MRMQIPSPRSADRRGFVLILAMVALLILTVMGVAAITVAQFDMRIARNIRHNKQIIYVAEAGVAQVADEFEQNQGLPATTSYNLLTGGDGQGCLPGWIDASGTGQAVPWLMGTPVPTDPVFGTYSVDLCFATCSGIPGAGEDLSAQEEKKVAFTLEAISRGFKPNEPAQVGISGNYLVRVQSTGECGGGTN